MDLYLYVPHMCNGISDMSISSKTLASAQNVKYIENIISHPWVLCFNLLYQRSPPRADVEQFLPRLQHPFSHLLKHCHIHCFLSQIPI